MYVYTRGRTESEAFGSPWRVIKKLASISRQKDATPGAAGRPASFSNFTGRPTGEIPTKKVQREGTVIFRTALDVLNARDFDNVLRIIDNESPSALFEDYDGIWSRGPEEVARGLYGSKISTGPMSETFNIDGTAHKAPNWHVRAHRVKVS